MKKRGTGPAIDVYDDQGRLSYETVFQMYQQTLSPMRLVDRNFYIIHQNPAMDRQVQLSAPQATGKKCYEVARSRESCGTDQCPLAQILAGEKQVEQYYHCELWNGSEFPAWVLATPYYDKDHNVVGSLQVLRDESHVVAFSQELEKKNKALGKTLHLISGYNEIFKVLNRETLTENLVHRTLRLLSSYTPAIMGVAYRFIEEDSRLVPIATYALDRPPRDFLLGEGLPGEVALEEKPIYLTKIPEGYFRISSGSGELTPSALACLPISATGRFIGVLELAALAPLTEHRDFLEDVANQLGIAMLNASTLQRTVELAAELQAQNEKLEAQNEELRAQGEELVAQSEEIQSQAEELAAQHEALERKSSEADEANRMKSVFLSNMSHELRTPLNAILGLSRLMRDRASGPLTETQEQYLDVVLRNGTNLLDLINDILDLTRIETGREELRFDKIMLRGFLESLCGNIQSLAVRKGLTCGLNIAPEISTMISDERKLRQILTNLLGNAIKFTEQGAVNLSVTLTATQDNEYIHFVVEDTGIGIPPGYEESIFEPFKQVDGSTTRKYGGSGLGLSICKRLVFLLGGTISVKSQVGAGSVFTITLPMDRRSKQRLPDKEWQDRLRHMLLPGTRPSGALEVSVPGQEPNLETIPAETGVQAQSRHILLVEDDMIALRELGVHLQQAGYRISFAVNGEIGLSLLEKHRPDLVMLDLHMPVMDGHAFLKEMRGRPHLARIPVLILTAMDLEPAVVNSLPANVRGILRKGDISCKDLLEQIKLPLDKLFALPNAAPAKEELSTSIPPARCKRPTGKPLVLVAEDNPDNLFFLEEVLASCGHEIIRAKNGREAVEMAKNHAPDLILMDIQMPDMSGLDAITCLRHDQNLKDIPIVAITARAMKGDREKIMAAGCNDYIPKPVDTAILIAMLEKWLPREQQSK